MTWADAMGLVVLEGIVMLILVLTGFRTAMFRAVPRELKVAISVGIGLFIALLGFFDSGFVRPGSGTPLQLGIGGSLAGWPSLVFVVGLLLTLVLMVRKVRGAILISIIVMTVARSCRPRSRSGRRATRTPAAGPSTCPSGRTRSSPCPTSRSSATSRSPAGSASSAS
jgi:xanthine/uracil/vitamin C permease (AzgA family)